jgi:hypothetical protein
MKPAKRHTGMVLRALLLGLMALPAAARSQGVKTPAGELRNAGPADLKPHPSGSKTYNEFWTYQLHLDGNLQAVLNISRVNLGSFKAPVCGADLTLLGFKGRNWSVAREYAKSNFVFTDSLQQLKVHKDIWFAGRLPEAHRIFFSTRKNNVAYFLDLEFAEILPGKVWGDGMFRLGAETVGIFIHIPRAKVKGRIAVNGDTLQVSGTAYMDHTFQTALAPELVDGGYRHIRQDGTVEVGYFLDPDARFGNLPVGYGLRQDAGGLVLLKPTALSVLSAGKALEVKVATKVEIAFADGSKALIERSQDRHRQSVLHEFSGITKMAIKNFMGGEILTFKGMGTLNGAAPTAYDFFVVD